MHYLWYHLQNQIVMREYTKKPENQSRTLNSNPRASRQAPIADILQAYKNVTLGRQSVQRESMENEELLQAKTSGQAPANVILQRHKESMQRYASEENDELLQGKFDTTQREEINEEELIQGKFESTSTKEQESIQREEKSNNTGLPDNLKTGIENLSGYSMDDVKVHYNSDKPAQLNALAYAQGTDIHVAPGQEKHLRHEAWHVVQQKQGRVQPTMQMQGVNVNDSEGLEKEADMMGGKAFQMANIQGQVTSISPIFSTGSTSGDMPVQRIRIKLDHGIDNIMNNVRSSPIPQPGEIMVDGFRNYEPNHRAIEMNENIILEGHGTYLDPNHDEGADYDSQAYLTPRQLANVAFLVPKNNNWAGQIILFGCNTGPLTMEVSRHYLALTGTPVNVIGTLADIRMEVPNSQHPDGHLRPAHTAEYDEDENHTYPTAPGGNISSRERVRVWLTQGKATVAVIRAEIKNFYDIEDEVRANNVGRNTLREAIVPSVENINQILTTSLNYQGLIYGGTDSSLYQIEMIREMMITAVSELLLFEEMLRFNDTSLSELQNKALEFIEFFNQLIYELNALGQITILAEESYPSGTVDWEGENVINSRAEEYLDEVQLNRAEINSDRWGGGGQMLMLEQVLVQNYGEDDDLL